MRRFGGPAATLILNFADGWVDIQAPWGPPDRNIKKPITEAPLIIVLIEHREEQANIIVKYNTL